MLSFFLSSWLVHVGREGEEYVCGYSIFAKARLTQKGSSCLLNLRE